MAKFSANLGFLWTEKSLPDAIAAAKKAGFDAVECHWPYDYDADEIVRALSDAELEMLGLNTLRGDSHNGEAGLSAIPGREIEARRYIDQAIEYATAISAKNVHVMAGRSSGDGTAVKDKATFRRAAHLCFVENLRYATEQAAKQNINILIEPINLRDIPDYFLNTVEQADNLINEVQADNLKIMFDCYHIQITSGDLIKRLERHLAHIGHIQIAAVPTRAEPDEGEICYPRLIKAIDAMGYTGYLGAEYKPRSDTQSGLSWMDNYRSSSQQ